MIDFKQLTARDRQLLADSRFGDLPASRIPAEWRRLIERDLADRDVIARDEDEPVADLDGGAHEQD